MQPPPSRPQAGRTDAPPTMSDFSDYLKGESPAVRNNKIAPLDPDEKVNLRITCAWCGAVIEEGPGPVSHGMCAGCHASFLAMVPGA